MGQSIDFACLPTQVIECTLNAERARERRNEGREEDARISGFFDKKLHRRRGAVPETAKLGRPYMIAHPA